MTTSIDRKLARCAREIAATKAKAEAPTNGLTSTEPETQMLPDGVWESAPGVYKAKCRSCGETYELVYDPSDFTEEGNYCGGSPRCCP